MNAPLHLQNATKAAPATKIRASILATALVDALGGPAEFHGRFSFDVVDSMIPNANFSSSRRLDRRHIHDPLSGTVTHHLPP